MNIKKTTPQPQQKQTQTEPRAVIKDDGTVYHFKEKVGDRIINSLMIPGTGQMINTEYTRISNFSRGYAVIEQEIEIKPGIIVSKLGIVGLNKCGIKEFCPAVADKIEIKDGYAYLLVGARTTRLKLEPVSAPKGTLAPEYEDPQQLIEDIKKLK